MILVIYVCVCVYIYLPLKIIALEKNLDLLVLLAERLLDHHTGEELETGYFL